MKMSGQCRLAADGEPTDRTSITISLNICKIQISLKTILEIPFEDAQTSHTSALNNES